MKLIEYLEDKDVYEFADRLLISKTYLQSIAREVVKPSKRLAKLIEVQTKGKVKAEELLSLKGPLKCKCPHCGQYMRVKT